jgi:hypothetical protein
MDRAASAGQAARTRIRLPLKSLGSVPSSIIPLFVKGVLSGNRAIRGMRDLTPQWRDQRINSRQ